jgi:hypothetical protein
MNTLSRSRDTSSILSGGIMLGNVDSPKRRMQSVPMRWWLDMPSLHLSPSELKDYVVEGKLYLYAS